MPVIRWSRSPEVQVQVDDLHRIPSRIQLRIARLQLRHDPSQQVLRKIRRLQRRESEILDAIQDQKMNILGPTMDLVTRYERLASERFLRGDENGASRWGQ